MPIEPFASKDDAAYWGGRFVVETIDGRWWCLGGVNTPTGTSLYHIGARLDRQPGESPAASSEGWPPMHTLKQRVCWSTPEGVDREHCVALTTDTDAAHHSR